MYNFRILIGQQMKLLITYDLHGSQRPFMWLIWINKTNLTRYKAVITQKKKGI